MILVSNPIVFSNVSLMLYSVAISLGFILTLAYIIRGSQIEKLNEKSLMIGFGILFLFCTLAI